MATQKICCFLITLVSDIGVSSEASTGADGDVSSGGATNTVSSNVQGLARVANARYGKILDENYF